MKKYFAVSSLGGLLAASALVLMPAAAHATAPTAAVNAACQADQGWSEDGTVVSTKITPVAGSYKIVEQVVDYDGKPCFAVTGEGMLPANFSTVDVVITSVMSGVKDGERVILVGAKCSNGTYDNGTKFFCPLPSATVAWAVAFPKITKFTDLELRNTFVVTGTPDATAAKATRDAAVSAAKKTRDAKASAAKKTRDSKVSAAKKAAKKKIAKIKKSKIKAKAKKAKIAKVNKAKNKKVSKAKTTMKNVVKKADATYAAAVKAADAAYASAVKAETVTAKSVTRL